MCSSYYPGVLSKNNKNCIKISSPVKGYHSFLQMEVRFDRVWKNSRFPNHQTGAQPTKPDGPAPVPLQDQGPYYLWINKIR